MRIPKVSAVVLAASLSTGASYAQVAFELPANVPIPQSTLTRAEVIADALLWQASGLYDLNNLPDVDTYSFQYRQDEAKYAYLRQSSTFAALVEQIKRNGSTAIKIVQR